MSYHRTSQTTSITAHGRQVVEQQARGYAKGAFLSAESQANNGGLLDFSQLKGKKVLLINTAFNCGYTGQDEELQQLHEELQGKVVVVGFPANDFLEQEKSNAADIAQFCQVNYCVTFSLARKSSVVKGEEQNLVYQWLTRAEQNGWNNH